MDDVEPLINSKESQLSDQQTRINEIINRKLNKMSIIEIMKNQLFIVNFIKRNIDLQTINTYSQFIQWICTSLMKICKDTDTKILTHKYYYVKKINEQQSCTSISNQGVKISRSLYHFCKDMHECKNVYCKEHHFVYHLLYADVNALYEYIKNNTVFDIKEIIKSLTTIHYVLQHMMNELLKRC
jgi:hypothetical protein